MKKYPLHEDFKCLEDFKFPFNKAIFSFADKGLDIPFLLQQSDEEVTVRKALINGYKGKKIRALVYEPASIEENAPCLIFYHGGGFAFKAAPSHYGIAKKYALGAGCKVILPDYSTVPHSPFPIPAAECYSVYMWTLKYAEKLGIDRDRIAICGDSAGGCLAAAVNLIIRDKGIKQPCMQMLLYPVTDRRMTTESMKEFTDTPVWNAQLNKKMWDLYLPDENVKHIGYASPMEADDLSGLPDTYIETAEFDCLHDEGIAYAQRLISEGNNVEVYQTKGTPHGFELVDDSEIVKRSIDRRCSALKKAFCNIDK